MKLTSIGAAVIPLVIVGTLRACHCYKFTSGKSFLPSKAPLFHAPICKTSTGRLRSCIFSVKLPCHFFTSGAVRGRDASLTSLKKMLWLYNYSACLFLLWKRKHLEFIHLRCNLVFVPTQLGKVPREYVHCMQNSRNELGGPALISAMRGGKNLSSMSFTFTVSSTWPGGNQRCWSCAPRSEPTCGKFSISN